MKNSQPKKQLPAVRLGSIFVAGLGATQQQHTHSSSNIHNSNTHSSNIGSGNSNLTPF